MCMITGLQEGPKEMHTWPNDPWPEAGNLCDCGKVARPEWGDANQKRIDLDQRKQALVQGLKDMDFDKLILKSRCNTADGWI